MIKSLRLETIVQLLKTRQTMAIDELVQTLNTTVPTLHRDLDILEEQGLVRKVHGGVQYVHRVIEEDYFDKKMQENVKAKEEIAKLAASQVHSGETVFLDAGSTTIRIIPYLANKKIIVFTNGLTHINDLIKYNIESYLVGGFIKPTTQAIAGEDAIQFIQKFYFDISFIGTNGISTEQGYSTPDVREGNFKQSVLGRSRKVFFLGDQSKFDQSFMFQIAALKDYPLITDQVPEIFRSKISFLEVVK